MRGVRGRTGRMAECSPGGRPGSLALLGGLLLACAVCQSATGSSPGAGQEREPPEPVEELVARLRDVVQRDRGSCNRIVRDAWAVSLGWANSQRWSDVTAGLKRAGVTDISPPQRGAYVTSTHRYLVEADACPGDGCGLGLTLVIQARPLPGPILSLEPGQVWAAWTELSTECSVPWRQMVAEGWYGENSAVQRIFREAHLGESLFGEGEAVRCLRDMMASFPRIDGISVGYGEASYLSEFGRPAAAGFGVTLEFSEVLAGSPIDRSLTFTVESGLDAPGSLYSSKSKRGFSDESKDTLSRIRWMGGSASWMRQDRPPPPSWERRATLLRRVRPIAGREGRGEPHVPLAHSASPSSAEELWALPASTARVWVPEDVLHDDDLRALARCPDLQTLDLMECHTLSDVGLVHLAPLRSLRRLTLSGQRLDGTGLTHLQDLQQLRTLTIAWSAGLTENGLANIGSLGALRRLELWASHNVADQGVKHLGHLRQLRHLTLAGGKITDEGLAAIAGLPELEELDMRALHGVTDEGIGHLTKLKKLRKLSLRWMSLGNEALEQVGTMPALQSLELCWLDVTDDGLQNLAGLSDLQELKVYGCGGITEEGMRGLGQVLPGRYEVSTSAPDFLDGVYR